MSNIGSENEIAEENDDIVDNNDADINDVDIDADADADADADVDADADDTDDDIDDDAGDNNTDDDNTDDDDTDEDDTDENDTDDDMDDDVEGDIKDEVDGNADTDVDKKKSGMLANKMITKIESDDDDDDDEDDEDYDDENEDEYYKFDEETRQTFLEDHHPESKIHNYEEILLLSKVVRNNDGIVIDDYHQTLPFLTKYERTRILGQRAKQLDDGANSFISVPQNIIDGYQIAELELEEKKIPFIIRRPLPNGNSEYWKIEDLEIF